MNWGEEEEPWVRRSRGGGEEEPLGVSGPGELDPVRIGGSPQTQG